MAQQPNLNQMMQQLQQAQAEMQAAQAKLKDEVVEASAGGGMVSVKLSGALDVLEVKIDPAAVDPAEVEILQDMVVAAVNEALRSAHELGEKRLGAIAGGLGLPGM